MLDGGDDNLRLLKWDIVDGTVNVVTGRQVGSGWETAGGSGDNFMRKLFTPAQEHAVVTAGFACNVEAYAGATLSRGRMCTWLADGALTTHVGFGIDNNGRLSFYRGPFGTGTLLGITSVVLQIGVWHYVECRVVLSDTIGEVQCWVDGILEINATGIDTKNAGTDLVFDAWQFHWDQSSLHEPNYDDFYLTNGAGAAPYNGRLGDIVIETILPVGNGATNNFVGSDGNSVDNYLLVDEVTPDGDTTYAQSAANGDIDLYAFQDLALPGLAIRGVQATADAKHLGVADNARLVTRIGGANFNGADLPVAAGYSDLVEIWDVSPATGVHWTIAEINAAEFGLEDRA